MKQIRVFQLHCLVGLALFVHQQGKSDSRFFAESSGVSAIAKSDGRKNGSALAKCRFVGAQLRYVLAAENSTVMPQEHDDDRLPQPKRGEANFGAFPVRPR